MGLLLTGTLGTGAYWLRLPQISPLVVLLFGASGLLWGIGQVLSLRAAQKLR